MRKNNRGYNKLRRVKLTPGFNRYAEGSCLIEAGDTKVICTASVENKVPLFIKGTDTGWITAEYAMLPRSCQARQLRDASRGVPSARNQEIKRLIGRSLRSVVNLAALGERTIWIDCDVIQGDGGTRTASITGGFVALAEAIIYLRKNNLVKGKIIRVYLAAVSVGIVDGKSLLDLDYEEDFQAEVDMNIVMTGKGEFVEIQGSAEKHPFSGKELEKLLNLAREGIEELISLQKKTIPVK
jgi:ribonuclease PH